MKKYNRVIALLAATSMTATLMAGCGKTSTPAETTETTAAETTETTTTEAPAAETTETAEATEEVDANLPSLVGVEPDTRLAADAYSELWDVDSYQTESSEVYERILGSFNEAYQKALAVSDVSERYALMAVAEAKMLESGVFIPLTTRGGNYGIRRTAAGSVTDTLWGNDDYRFHNAIVATELLAAEDYAETKKMREELKGTGTYREKVKAFLTDKGYELKDTFNVGYTSDPKTWDVLATSRAADSEVLVNLYDGLTEYDCENVQQPALAESWEVSSDGTVYTFKIREGVKWVDSQGREVADLTADDFVAGMQHMMDAMGGLEYLVQGVIVGADEYINGESTDFSTVGVKAVDDYTLEYTLVEPKPYFMTMLSYGVFAPLSRTYYEGQGGQFGQGTGSGNYGTDPDHIAYCGPFLITSHTEKNSIIFKANPSYWNADNQEISTMTWVFEDGTDVTKTYNDCLAGTIDSAGLNTSTIETAKADGNFEKHAVISNTDATTFCGFINTNRKAFVNFNDSTTAKSEKTVWDGQRTAIALQNQNFRLAVVTSLDRASYNAQSMGEELKLNNVRNSYTPGTFVTLPEEVTIDINGTATTFAAGTRFGEIVQAQIDADGVKIKAWDSNADGGVGSSDGFDGWYNPSAAKEYLAAATEELAKQGVEISKENPIQIDLPYFSGSETYTNRANAFKQSLEASLDGNVVINLIKCESADDWYYAGYYPDYGYEMNADMMDVSGWGPDYGDPQTYLDTMLPDYAGYMVKSLGVF
ncbi:MAG: peptide ABC transporter substrate-binding protein [Butyrivibrio sp.]|nr:peptide ABC transporter substrate-binding protein [Butyrivibrio sp.]